MARVERDARRGVGPELTVLFDADCGFCSRCAMALERLDVHRRLWLLPLQSAAPDHGTPGHEELLNALHVRDGEGRWVRGGAACLRIAAAIPALRPLAVAGRLPVLRALVEPAYRLVARNRHGLGRLLGVGACTYRPVHRW